MLQLKYDSFSTYIFSFDFVCFRDHFLPLVYCLLPNKHQDTYYTVLEIVKREMAKIDIAFNPPQILTDFELGLINKLPVLFPNARLRGCYFHHTQCIWRRVQSLGLTTDYRDNPDVRSFVRQLMALAFLPVPIVRPMFSFLEEHPTATSQPACSLLLSYYKDTWLNGSFPLPFWNVHNEGTRTNNHLEGWHSKLNKAVRKIHPSVHDLVAVLKVEQGETELVIQRARLGAAPAPRKKKYRGLDSRLERLRTQFRSGDMSSNEFLDAVQHLVHHY